MSVRLSIRSRGISGSVGYGSRPAACLGIEAKARRPVAIGRLPKSGNPSQGGVSVAGCPGALRGAAHNLKLQPTGGLLPVIGPRRERLVVVPALQLEVLVEPIPGVVFREAIPVLVAVADSAQGLVREAAGLDGVEKNRRRVDGAASHHGDERRAVTGHIDFTDRTPVGRRANHNFDAGTARTPGHPRRRRRRRRCYRQCGRGRGRRWAGSARAGSGRWRG